MVQEKTLVQGSECAGGIGGNGSPQSNPAHHPFAA